MKLVLGLLVLLLGSGCPAKTDPDPVGAQLFQSPQVNGIALTSDGGRLLVANTTSNTISVFDTALLPGDPEGALLAEIPVGVDPVGIAIRPPAGGPNLALVTNHISDSISVIDLDTLVLVQTLQALDGDGVTTTDAPSGVVFANASRAFVALDDRNEVIVIDFDAEGRASINAERLVITAQAPRALAVVGDRLIVGAFESGNQTEFPACGPEDTEATRPFLPDDPHDEGCLNYARFLEDLEVTNNLEEINVTFGTIVDFAARSPNIGGEVVIDRDRPDRDLFVFDVNGLGAPVEVLESVSTLLYGMASHGDRVWLTSTHGRNDRDGLDALENRMFENRLTALTCAPNCSVDGHTDLDQNGHGVPVPTPYGIRASGNGQTLVATVAGSDGDPGLHGNPAVNIPGLVTLDTNGQVLGHVQTGAIPQSVALASDPDGNAQTAYVLNVVDSSVSVVDVSNAAAPTVLATFEVGNDPVPEPIREGRKLFMSARASTKGTFSCESCHPNGNTDQLLWTINQTFSQRDVGYTCDTQAENCPEPRTTMPVRGLRDTLPLHWAGTLADPFEDPEDFIFIPEDDGAPDCDLELDGEVGCARHLANASLSGVMCDQAGPGCQIGPSGLPGALTSDERDALAAFMMSVAYPPSPLRRPDDALSPEAFQGMADFFTDDDGLGVGSGALGVGQFVGFAPITCADNSGGCHALPHGVATNSPTVGGFDAPTMRGLWDRHVQFSNGLTGSEEVLVAMQACADGNPPGDHPVIGQLLAGDPCALSSVVIEGFFGFQLDPFPGVASGAPIYDPAVGFTEEGVFLSTFEALFRVAYGTQGEAQWQFINEMSVGFPGLYGRQLAIDRTNVAEQASLDALDQLIEAAEQGKIDLRAVVHKTSFRFGPEDGLWRTSDPEAEGVPTGQLLGRVSHLGRVATFTAHLSPEVQIAEPGRQPLIFEEPELKVAEEIGDLLPIPITNGQPGETFRIGAAHVHPDATVLIDGQLCDSCSFTMGSTPAGDHLDVTIGDGLALGLYVMQVQNPGGWASNELPLRVADDIVIVLP